MSEEILKALMQLFAIIYKQDDGDNDLLDEYVKEFLLTQISREKFDTYYDQYTGYINAGSSEDGSVKRTSVKDSVRTLALCKRINKTLSQKQKSIVLVRLAEFVYLAETLSDLRLELLKTIGQVFRVDKQEYKNIEDFSAANSIEDVVKNETFQVYLDKSHFEIENEAFHQKDGLNAIFFFSIIESAGIVLFRYFGDLNVNLNGLQIKEKKTYVVNDGSTIRTPKSSIFFSEVLTNYRKKETNENILFDASIPKYTFPNGKVALEGINIVEESGTLFGIMGGSGAGKTTLLNVLSGIDPTPQATVKLNGYDISSSESKSNVGFIPQDDLLMEELTVYQNLYFNAKLLNDTWGEEELQERIEKVLKELGLYEIRDIAVGNPLNKKISGGQRKRLNIALELIREPLVLFVDEPTSGLSSKDSENVMQLLKHLAQTGKIIFVVIHQPASEIYKLFDKLFILDVGGLPVYYGNPIEAVIYFKTVTNQINHEIGECGTCGNVTPEQIFDTLEDKEIDDFGNYTSERKIKPATWNEYFKEKFVSKKVDKSIPLDKLETIKSPNLLKQFKVFFTRDFLSRWNDKQYVLIALLEAPVLAALLSFIIKSSNNIDQEYTLSMNENVPAYIFMLISVALFVGLTISAEEIFKDQKILKREKFLQLSRLSYLKSKAIYLILLSVLQSLLLCGVGNLIIELNDNFFYYWILIFSVFVFGNILGLLLSSSFKTIVTIYIIIPLIVIPQMILGGAMFKFENLNKSIGGGHHIPVVSNLMVSRWAYEGIMVAQFSNNKYEKNVFDYEQLLSDYNYRTSYLYPYLTDLLNDQLSDNKDESLKCSDTVYNTLVFEASKPMVKNVLEFDLNDHSIQTSMQFIEDLSTLYQDKYNELSRKKDAKIMEMDRSLGENALMNLKRSYHNDNVADIVQNALSKKKFFVENSMVYQNYDHIFLRDHLNPDYKIDGTFMYVPIKSFFGNKISTFWYNILVIWFFIFVLFIVLYFDGLKKLLDIQIFKKKSFS